MIRMTMLITMAIATLSAEPRQTCIYFGEDVGSEGAHHEAARICADGTVTVTVGAFVPGLQDLYGKPVRVKAVKTERANQSEPFVQAEQPVLASLAVAAQRAAAAWQTAIPVRAIRYGPTNGECENSEGAITQIALTDYATRIITINSACDWSQGYVSATLLTAVLTHEMGHLLLGPEHSLDPKDIMFSIVALTGQTITPEDRARVAEVARR